MNNNKGFTLIEVLISIVLLAVMIAGGMALTFNADRISTEAVHTKIATDAVNSELEYIKNLDYKLLFPDSQLPLPRHPPLEVTVLLSVDKYPYIYPKTITVGGLNGSMDVYVTAIDRDADNITEYKKVNVKCTWREVDRGSDEVITVSTLIAP